MGSSIPEKMKALVLTEPGAFKIQEIPVPVPGPDEVLCRVGAVAICGSDTRIIGGGSAGFWPPSYPFTPGHEWSGEVVAVGENVLNVKPGPAQQHLCRAEGRHRQPRCRVKLQEQVRQYGAAVQAVRPPQGGRL